MPFHDDRPPLSRKDDAVLGKLEKASDVLEIPASAVPHSVLHPARVECPVRPKIPHMCLFYATFRRFTTALWNAFEPHGGQIPTLILSVAKDPIKRAERYKASPLRGEGVCRKADG